MLEQDITLQKDCKQPSPTRNKRLKAKDNDSLASALKQNLKRRKAGMSRNSTDITLASAKTGQL